MPATETGVPSSAPGLTPPVNQACSAQTPTENGKIALSWSPFATIGPVLVSGVTFAPGQADELTEATPPAVARKASNVERVPDPGWGVYLVMVTFCPPTWFQLVIVQSP